MEEDRKLLGMDLATASPEVIEVLLDDSSDPEVFDEVAHSNTGRPEVLQMVLEHPDTPDEVRQYITGLMKLPTAPEKKKRAEATPEARQESLVQRLQRLTVSARIQLALKGGREIRGILVRDSNKEVMLSVLENGKITESEVEMMAKSRQTLEEALRRIARNRDWMKNYSVVQGLVSNPKTPAGIAVAHVSDLKTKDLVILEKNKNVAEVVRSASKKLLQARKPK